LTLRPLALAAAAALPTMLLLASGPIATPAALAADEPPQCELDRPVVFSGLDYDSARFHNAVARRIVEAGYGCETDEIPGTVNVLMQGLGRGDVDVTMEVWKENAAEPWGEFVEKGLVKEAGVNFPDAVEGWWVPRYLVEGPDAKAPDLKSVSDLPKYKDLFSDPEEPGKGRFVNCIAGWVCEEVNTKKLAAYDLEDDYTNFRPGTGAAMDANIASNYQRQQPFLTYYWGPTSILGRFDLVMLEEPPYDPQVWEEMMASEDPERATAYPRSTVVIGVNSKFAEQAPKLMEFLGRYRTSNQLVSDALAYMEENDVEPDAAAEHFLRTREDVWTEWVDEATAERVRESLG
jgi:glycine betaine/proline transport system substrate-binding protein